MEEQPEGGGTSALKVKRPCGARTGTCAARRMASPLQFTEPIGILMVEPAGIRWLQAMLKVSEVLLAGHVLQILVV